MMHGMRLAFPPTCLMVALVLAMLLSAAKPAAATTHYIAASGSDSNNGTSQSAPWLHAPGMPNCTASCASYTPQAGDKFIFRGGDTWHFGNSGLSPYTGGTWAWTWNGSNGNPIYIGVDKTWSSGPTWSRPVLTGDNPLTPNPRTPGDSVASCSFRIGAYNVMWSATVVGYYTLDNFEMTGLCYNTPGQPNHQDDYIDNNGSHDTLIQNVYVHGWSHIPLGGSMQVNCKVVEGGSGGMGANQQVGETFSHFIADGADSDPAGCEANQFDGWYDVEYSVFRYITQGLPTLAHNFHDNLFEYWYWSPNAGHQNVLEFDGNEWNGPINVFYNNVFRHIYIGGSGGNVVIWPEPPTGTTDYWFNNVIYDTFGGGNYFDIGQNSGTQGTLLIFNNTFEQSDANAVFGFLCSASHPFTTSNNHYIDNVSPYSGGGCQGTYVTDMSMTHSAATSANYLQSSTYAYYPPSGGATIGTGTNRQSYCTALLGSGDSLVQAAGNACQKDTTYAVSYNSATHTVNGAGKPVVSRPQTAAWDVGAYQTSPQSSGPNSPTGLAAVVQ